jgi:cob(I)alamin adenosyltransferase
MVRLNRIYTRGGDRGETSLADGSRVPKDDPRVESYGTVNEANAAIGLARLHSSALVDTDIDIILMRIQNDLFDLGADLATPQSTNMSLRIQPSQVERLEREIDAMNESLRPLESFILPGGTPLAAALHMALTVVRRAERLTVSLAASEEINSEAVKYLNRLSDHLFVLARRANDNGALDILWVPGAHR